MNRGSFERTTVSGQGQRRPGFNEAPIHESGKWPVEGQLSPGERALQ